jgi:four helix bundle protein
MALAHHTLIAWQRANNLFVKLHRLSFTSFPASERYELGAQLRRAAFSVAANIVEGFATNYPRRQLQFLDTSKSSLAEVGYCVEAAQQLGYLAEHTAKDLATQLTHATYPGDSTSATTGIS